MSRALHTAATGMQVQQMNVDNIANNLANASTVGFKRSRLEFQDILYQNLRTPGAAANSSTQTPVGLQIGLGARAISSERIFLQGDFKQTENPLDMVIEGSGFFQVRMASGELAYTRAGSFHLNAQGQVVTATGESLEPAITIPGEATSISIGTDGTVSVTLPGQANAQNVGQIQLASFANPAGLESMGRNLFKETARFGTGDRRLARRQRPRAHQSGFYRRLERQRRRRTGHDDRGATRLRDQLEGHLRRRPDARHHQSGGIVKKEGRQADRQQAEGVWPRGSCASAFALCLFLALFPRHSGAGGRAASVGAGGNVGHRAG